MVVNNLGYIFECRQDALEAFGVMEKFKVLYRNNEQRVTFTIAVDSSGKIAMPAYNDLSLGFKPLASFFKSEVEIESFVRSNKPYFGKLGSFSLIASGTIIFDVNTGEILSSENVGFYIPKNMSTSLKAFVDNKGVVQPALICERLSTSAGMNLFVVSDSIYRGYLTNLLSCFSVEGTKDREAFFKSILRG